MPYQKWFNQTQKKVTPTSGVGMYFKTAIFGFIIFALAYAYTSYMKTPNVLNKSVADTAIILMGLSMMLSSLCYFWDFVDTKIVYRKYLGLMGYAFGIVHIAMSFEALQSLLSAETWQEGVPWALATGGAAAIIFSIMALISNQYAANELGGKLWRYILRTGYLAVLLIWFHVVLLKSKYWIKWFDGGMKTLPSMSLIVAVFITLVLLMRIALWWSLRRRSMQMQGLK